MTRSLPDRVRPVAEYLATTHGLYLHNAAFMPGSTCGVCAKPLNHPLDEVCPECQAHLRAGAPLADRVGVLIYAEKYESQGYKVVHQYKGPRPAQEISRVMTSLFALGLRGHVECVMKMAGAASTGWAVMPSSKGRAALGGIVRGLAQRSHDDREVTLETATDFRRRQFRPENFVVTSGIASDHVILVDDSWVSGSNAQSAAAALKQAGAQDVSVFVVARILDPGYQPTKRFLDANGRPPFVPTTCPWTGGLCP